MYKKLHFQVEDSSGLPVYRQLMDQIRKYVVVGILENGDQLPSIRELASQIAVNPQTVVKAYNELEHAGVLEMRRGRGAFLTEGAHALVGIDYDKHLNDSLRSILVEAQHAGYTTDQIKRIVGQVIDEVDSDPVVKPGPEPNLKIIGGGSP